MEEEMRELCIEGVAIHDGPAHALMLVRVLVKRWCRGTCRPGY
jgi:hypothetical protein